MRAILGRIGLLSALLARAHGITSGSALGPASSPKPRCRLFVESSPLQAGVRVQLSEGQQHYLMSVMRVSDQATVLLFDGHSGEWLARINREGRRYVHTQGLHLHAARADTAAAELAGRYRPPLCTSQTQAARAAR
mmetsp:Transcript_37460/g.93163  ORF Transcript_37460/g.93163 Transcript_37460/m.93163 type:complete len:136 (-) Transcript_37460:55-462(-)